MAKLKGIIPLLLIAKPCLIQLYLRVIIVEVSDSCIRLRNEAR